MIILAVTKKPVLILKRVLVMKKVYLVVDARTLSSVSLATTNQLQAQKYCHQVSRLLKSPQAVVTKCWFDLPYGFRIELRKYFEKNLKWDETV